jgi:hypothetical protein
VVLAIGWSLVVVGVVGLALPLLQGVLLIVLGLYVLSRESTWARRRLEELRSRHPAVDGTLRRWRSKLRVIRRERTPAGEPTAAGDRRADPDASRRAGRMGADRGATARDRAPDESQKEEHRDSRG